MIGDGLLSLRLCFKWRGSWAPASSLQATGLCGWSSTPQPELLRANHPRQVHGADATPGGGAEDGAGVECCTGHGARDGYPHHLPHINGGRMKKAEPHHPAKGNLCRTFDSTALGAQSSCMECCYPVLVDGSRVWAIHITCDVAIWAQDPESAETQSSIQALHCLQGTASAGGAEHFSAGMLGASLGG